MRTEGRFGSACAKTLQHDTMRPVIVILAVTDGEKIKITFNSLIFILKFI